MGEGCAVSGVGFSVPISGASSIAGKGGSCGIEGFQLSPWVEQEDTEFFTVPTEPH